MATYAELHELMNDSGLLDKIEVAVVIAAQGIVGQTATNQVKREAWAEKAFTSPRGTAKIMLPGILAANKAVTVTAILAAGDNAIQTQTDSLVDLFADLIP